MKKLEKQIQGEILRALEIHTDAKVWRQNTGAASFESKGRRHFVRFGIKGAADLTGICPDGRRLEVEVKRPGNKPTDHQIAYGQMILEYGGVYILAHSAEEAIDSYRRQMDEGSE